MGPKGYLLLSSKFMTKSISFVEQMLRMVLTSELLTETSDLLATDGSTGREQSENKVLVDEPLFVSHA